MIATVEMTHFESVRAGDSVYLPDKAVVPRVEDDVICRMIAMDQVTHTSKQASTHPVITTLSYMRCIPYDDRVEDEDDGSSHPPYLILLPTPLPHPPPTPLTSSSSHPPYLILLPPQPPERLSTHHAGSTLTSSSSHPHLTLTPRSPHPHLNTPPSERLSTHHARCRSPNPRHSIVRHPPTSAHQEPQSISMGRNRSSLCETTHLAKGGSLYCPFHTLSSLYCLLSYFTLTTTLVLPFSHPLLPHSLPALLVTNYLTPFPPVFGRSHVTRTRSPSPRSLIFGRWSFTHRWLMQQREGCETTRLISTKQLWSPYLLHGC